MATKYYCDGCDKELPPAMVVNMAITIKKGGEISGAGGNYELCKRCADNLAREANPKNWARCEPTVKMTA